MGSQQIVWATAPLHTEPVSTLWIRGGLGHLQPEAWGLLASAQVLSGFVPLQPPAHHNSQVEKELLSVQTGPPRGDSCEGTAEPLFPSRCQGLRVGEASQQRLPLPHDSGLSAHGARPWTRCHQGHHAEFEEGPTPAQQRKQTQMCLPGTRREKNRPLSLSCALPRGVGPAETCWAPGAARGRAKRTVPGRPLLPPRGARRAQPPLRGFPGRSPRFPLSPLLLLGRPGSHPLVPSLSPGPWPLPFNFLLSRGENLALEPTAARRRYWPAPRPAAPPPAPALPSAPHSLREWRRRRRRSLRGRACVCECAPASGSVCAPGAGWAALAPRRQRREPGGRVVIRAGEAAAAGPGRGWDSGGRAGHGAGKPALRQDAPASNQREALRRPARGLPGRGRANFSFSFALS